jgi:peroxiredoxin Q/BCP
MSLLNVGDQAPGFSAQNQDGGTVTLDQYRGKSVVLWWYPKAGTPG